MLDRVTDAEQAQRAESPPAASVIDRPEVNAAGWAWGDEGARAPLDAPLSALVSSAARLVGAFTGCAVQGIGASLAGLGVMRLLAARDGLKSSEVAARGWRGRRPGPYHVPGASATMMPMLSASR